MRILVVVVLLSCGPLPNKPVAVRTESQALAASSVTAWGCFRTDGHGGITTGRSDNVASITLSQPTEIIVELQNAMADSEAALVVTFDHGGGYYIPGVNVDSPSRLSIKAFDPYTPPGEPRYDVNGSWHREADFTERTLRGCFVVYD